MNSVCLQGSIACQGCIGHDICFEEKIQKDEEK